MIPDFEEIHRILTAALASGKIKCPIAVEEVTAFIVTGEYEEADEFSSQATSLEYWADDLMYGWSKLGSGESPHFLNILHRAYRHLSEMFPKPV